MDRDRRLIEGLRLTGSRADVSVFELVEWTRPVDDVVKAAESVVKAASELIRYRRQLEFLDRSTGHMPLRNVTRDTVRRLVVELADRLAEMDLLMDRTVHP